MSHLDQARAELDAARAELLDAIAAVGAGTTALLDLLWRAGLVEDYRRRVISHAVQGKPTPPFLDRPRPPIADSTAYLVEWLEQSRRPLRSLLERTPEGELDVSVTMADGGTTTPRELLRLIARDDRADAEHVRRLGSEPSEK